MRLFVLVLLVCSGCSIHSEFTIKGGINQTGEIESKQAEACYTLVMKRDK